MKWAGTASHDKEGKNATTRTGFASLALLAVLTLAFSSSAAPDLRILQIAPDTNGNVILTWSSRPREYYTVYAAHELTDWTIWHIVAARVPSGGDTTSWTDESAEAQRAGASLLAALANETSLSKEELAAKIESTKKRELQYPPLPPKEPRKDMPEWLKELLASPDRETLLAEYQAKSGASQIESLSSQSTTNARFYRIARAGTVGFVDGWGAEAANRPSSLTNILAVSASPYDSGTHSLALRTDGTLVSWGNNFYGQTNVPANLSDVVAMATGGRHTLALKADGSVVAWGDNSFGQVTNVPPGLTNVLDVKAGLWHSLALKADGTVAAWGDQFNRSNAVPAGLSNVIAIAAGPRHCLALKRDRTVIGWGFDLVVRGYYRMTNVPPYLIYLGATQTNAGIWLDAYSPTPTNLPPGFTVFGSYLPTNCPLSLTNVAAIAAGMEHNQALLADGQVFIWGRTNALAVQEPPPLTNATMIGAGWHQAVAVDTNTFIHGWGQGGCPEGLDSVVALSLGAMHALVIRTNNESPVIRSLRPGRINVPVGTQTNFTVVATTSTNVSLSYQWQRDVGTNDWVDLQGETNTTLQFVNLTRTNNGDYRVRASTPSRTVTSRPVAVEIIYRPEVLSETPDPEITIWAAQGTQTNISLCVTSEGSANVRFQWFTDSQARPDTTTVQPPTGSSIYPILLRDLSAQGHYQAVACNEAGCVTSRVWQVQVTCILGEAVAWGGTNYGQLGSDRSETNLIGVAAGAYHTLGLREDGTVIGWGDDSCGQTGAPYGHSNVIAIAAGDCHSLALRENGTVFAWGDNTYGQTNVPEALTNVTAIAAGGHHGLALRRNGTIAGWGWNNHGQASGFSSVTNAIGISAGAFHSLALLSDGTLRACGQHADGLLAPPTGLSNVVAVAAGFQHNLALKADGTVEAWGWNEAGEGVVPGGLNNVMAIAAGQYHNLALKNDGSVIAWGSNEYGQTNVPPLLDTYAISAGREHSVALAYNPLLVYPVDVSKDLLLLVNTHSTNSVAVLDYYRAHRPGVSNANVLEVSVPEGGPITNATYEMCSAASFTNDLQVPYLNWLTNHPTKRPRYVVMMYHVPSRWDGANSGSYSYSVARALSRDTPGRNPFITHLNMRTVDDCRAYIDKLETFGNLYSPGQLIISPRAGGYGNTNWLVDNVRHLNYASFSCIADARSALLALGISPGNVLYADNWDTNSQQYNLCRFCPDYCGGCSNVAGYVTWGRHGWSYGDWAHTNNLGIGSAWFIITAIESWNGQWGNDLGETRDLQYSFHRWFDSVAFCGTNYSNTPIGSLTNPYEPGFACFVNYGQYLSLWATGKTFAIAAWNALVGYDVQVTGDPFVKQ